MKQEPPRFTNTSFSDREFRELANRKDDSASMIDEQMRGHDSAESTVLLEVGCGPGNMLYPVRERVEKDHDNIMATECHLGI